MRKAVIDIGTNSVKLLVADWDPSPSAQLDRIQPVFESSIQTRLGRGLYNEGDLRPESIADTLEALSHFFDQAKALHATSIRMIATSAMREARNADTLKQAVRQQTGMDMEVLSGRQEAQLTFLGVTGSSGLVDTPLLIMDIGGGSTEFICGDRGNVEFQESYPIGSVRLLEQLKPGDPPTPSDWNRCREAILDFFEERIQETFRTHSKVSRRQDCVLVGTGGSTTLLAKMHLRMEAYDREILDHAIVPIEEIDQTRKQLWGLPLQDRRNIVGLPPERADVMLMGTALHAVFMERLGFSSIRNCTRGLRFGALVD